MTVLQDRGHGRLYRRLDFERFSLSILMKKVSGF